MVVARSLLACSIALCDAGRRRDHTNCIVHCTAANTACVAACAAANVVPFAGQVVFLACGAACVASQAACVSQCNTDAENCFDDDVMISTFSEACNEKDFNVTNTSCWSPRRIQDVSIGAKVMTIDASGVPLLTKAIANRRTFGQVDGCQLGVVVDDIAKYVTVTNHHVMLVYSDAALEPQLVAAENVRVGDLISFGGHLVRVSSNTKVELTHRNSLVTAEGTVLANDVLVTTLCEEYGMEVTRPHGGAFAVLRQWQLNHSATTV